MKTNEKESARSGGRRGSAVLVVLVLVGIMAVIVGGSFVAAHTLHGQLDSLEKKQIKRLESSALANTQQNEAK